VTDVNVSSHACVVFYVYLSPVSHLFVHNVDRLVVGLRLSVGYTKPIKNKTTFTL
jgi:hypothetical protein